MFQNSTAEGAFREHLKVRVTQYPKRLIEKKKSLSERSFRRQSATVSGVGVRRESEVLPSCWEMEDERSSMGCARGGDEE
jgi:hypothetical protein